MSPVVATHRRAFGVVGYAIVVMLAGSNLPTPLYPTYQAKFGLSPLTLTLVFATYAFTVMPCLLVFGPLSDAVGRKPVLLAAVAAGVVAASLFAAATSVAWLFAAQVVEGVAMGALQGSAVAALVETHPGGARDRAARVGAVATVSGAAVGPVAAGLLAQYGPFPQRLPYVDEGALLVVAFVALWRAYPAEHRKAQRWRPRRPSVPEPIRRTFALAAAAAFLAWAVAALFLSLVPGYVIALLGTRNVALIGGLASLLLACSALVQLATRRAPALVAQAVGLALVAAASGALILAAHVRSLWVIGAAAALGGFGLGLAFGGALAAVSAMAPEERKGDILASFYLMVYLGTALPVIGVGLVASGSGLLSAVQLFGYVIGAAALVGLVAVLVELRPRRVLPTAIGNRSRH